MKKVTRSSLAAIALTAVLGLTACGSGDKPADQEAPQGEAQDASNKPAGWVDKFDPTLALPAEWNEGAGWAGAFDQKSLVSFGNYFAYVDQSNKTAVVLDGKGEKKFATGAENEFDGNAEGFARVVMKDGKGHLVVGETGIGLLDPTSVKKAGPKTIIHVFDSEMKEVWKKTFTNTVVPRNDAIVVKDADGEATGSVIDVTTGELKVLSVPTGYVWAGNFEGVDIYALKEAKANGELTNGVWKYKAGKAIGGSSDSTALPTAFGKVISVERPSTHAKTCDLINPEDGAPLELGAASGACLTPLLSSPDGNYVVFDGSGNVSDGIISLSGKQLYSITEDIDFTPTSVTNSGLVYGKSGDGVAVFDFTKDTEPKKVPDVKQAPIMVAENGIAVFASGKFVIKK